MAVDKGGKLPLLPGLGRDLHPPPRQRQVPPPLRVRGPFYEEAYAWTYRRRDHWGVFSEAEWASLVTPYRMALRDARRFVVDDDLIRVVAQASIQQRRLPLWIELARLPFDKVWIEWDRQARHDAIRETGVAVAKGFDATSNRNGFLFQRDAASPSTWHATEFHVPDGMSHPSLMPMRLVLDTDGTEARPARGAGGMKPIDEACPSLERMLPGALMGYGGDDPNAGAREITSIGIFPWFAYKVSATVEPITHKLHLDDLGRARRGDPTGHAAKRVETHYAKSIRDRIMTRRGYMRTIITLLAMLNETPVTYRPVPAAQGKMDIPLRNIPHLAHETVGIALPKSRPLATLTRMLTAAYGRRRAHEVRGHWRRVTLSATDPDSRIGLDGKRKPVVIGEDGVARIWIGEHVRGDASIGWVRKDYALTASGEDG